MPYRFEVLELAEAAAAQTLTLVRTTPRHVRSYADQITRASGSVALNLAEGFGRRGKDKRHHYAIAYGSAQETLSALRILVAARAVGPEAPTELAARLDRVCALTWRLMHPR